MTAPLLTILYNDTSDTHKVYIMTGTTLEQLGSDIDDTSGSTPFGGPRYTNQVINAFGNIYAVGGRGIYKYQTGSTLGEWSRANVDGGYTYPVSAGNGGSTGIHFTTINSEPYICGSFTSAAFNQSRVWRINLLTESASSSAIDYDDPGFSTNIIFNGKIFSAGSNLSIGTPTAITDPENLTITLTAQPTSGVNSVYPSNATDFNIFDGKLYMLAQSRPSGAGTTGLPTLYEWGGGQFSATLNTFESVSRTYAGTDSKWCLFDDGINMYAIYYDANPSVEGWKLWQLDYDGASFTLGSELTNTVMPVALRPGNGASTSSGWTVYKSQNDDGTFDTFLSYASNNSGGSITMYQFIDNATLLSYVSSGAYSELTLPNWKLGGGDKVADLNAPQVCVYKRERGVGGQKVTYKAFPPISPIAGYDNADHTVSFHFGNNEGIPTVQALLTGTATGGSSVRIGNEINSVDTDGTTEYTATIQAFGFNDFDSINLTAKIS